MMRSIARSLAISVALLSAPAVAQEFPTGPVTIVVPFTPGGVTDLAARVVGDALQKKWGSPVVVENLPGAGGITGTQVALTRPHDGHTLVFQTTTLPGYPIFSKEVPFDVENDLAPVSLFAEGTFVLVTPKDSPFSTFDEMVEYARAHPGELNYAATGPGALMMNMESLKREFGLDIQQITYTGAAANYTAVLSGEVQLGLADIGRAREDAAAGLVKMLGISGDERSELAPDLPTLKELGASGVRGYWVSLFAPAGTPPEVVNKISADVAEIAQTPEVREAVSNFTFKLIASTPEELGARMHDEIVDWTLLFDALGMEKT